MKNKMNKNVSKGRVGRRLLSVLLALNLFITAFYGIVFFRDSGKIAKADTSVQIKIAGGAVLDDRQPNTMDVGEWPLEIQSSDISFDKPSDYEVTWGVQSGGGTVINMVDPSEPNIFKKNIQALAPGNATIYVQVYKTDDGHTRVGFASYTIEVTLGIDTSTGSSERYKKVYNDDTKKSLIMYTGEKNVQMKLNFGDATKAKWISDEEEIITVGENTGKVDAIGAGKTVLHAEYTYPGSTDPANAEIDVYVIPRLSQTNGMGYETNPSFVIDADNNSIYNDTFFKENSPNSVRGKIYWSIMVEAPPGSSEDKIEIANSSGKKSDLIDISPYRSNSNRMTVKGTAGEYYVYFYVYDSKHKDNIKDLGDSSYSPTMAKITIKSSVDDKDVVLGIGDSLNLPENYNMTDDDFKNTFSVLAPVIKEGGADAGNYVELNPDKTIVTAMKEETVLVRMKAKPDKIDYVKQLLGIDPDDPLPAGHEDGVFSITLIIVDGITLAPTAVVISLGQEYQLHASLHGDTLGEIYWASDSPSYVSVDPNTGLIKGLKVTTSDVKVKASVQMKGGVVRTASTVVKVEPAVTKFTLNPSGNQKMNVGDVLTMEAKIQEKVSVAPLRWISTKEDIFTVTPAADNKTAVINAISGGTGTLMVENTVNGERVTVDIIVQIPIESIEFTNKDGYKIPFYQNGHNMREEVKITPDNATSTDLVWTLEGSTSIATIDSSGYLKFKAPGRISVTVRPAYNPRGVYDTTIITIVGGPNDITFENLKDNILNVEVSEEKTVNLKFDPETATTSLVWRASRPGIVRLTYDEERKQLNVLGQGVGECIVSCRTDDNLVFEFTAIVTQGAESISFAYDAIDLILGSENKMTYQLVPVLKPDGATETITYTSRNTSIATVGTSGLVQAVAVGTTQIVATTSRGRTAIVDVFVSQAVMDLTQDFETGTVYVGESITITPGFVPETSTNKNIDWTWKGNGEVTLSGSSSVTVTGVKTGSVTLIGKSVDNKAAVVSYLLSVKTRKPVYKTVVTLSPKVKYLNVGKSYKVKSKVTGAYKGNKKLKWKSSNKKVATVSQKGKVKAKKVGKATITATAQDGSKKKDKMKVIVRRLVTKIKMNKSTANILVGGT
ncbi:MAG: Ig-like domain-containing protein, partial [Eubacterium sp.]|nr:Ig-like domain-containing protein [Eubacterium sp.]